MWPNPRGHADLATFTEKIFNGKLFFFFEVFLVHATKKVENRQ